MTDILLNGRDHHLPPGSTVADVIAEVTGRRLGPDGRAADGGGLGIAVARNKDVVPRSQWVTTAIVDGDALEILSAAQGG